MRSGDLALAEASVIVTLTRVWIYPNGIACAYHPYAVAGWSWGGPLVFAEQAIRMERVL